MEATLASKGRVAIPKTARDLHKLRLGAPREFFVDADGSVRIVPDTRSVSEPKTLLPQPARALGREQIDAVIALP